VTRVRRVSLVVGTVLGAFIAYEVITSFVAYTDDAYVRSDLIALAPQVTGQIVAVHVVDNQAVKAGDPILTIDPTPFQLLIAQRNAQIAESRSQVAADQDAIAAAQDALAAATSQRTYAADNQHRLSVLASSQDVSRADLDLADDQLRRAEAAMASAEADIARAQATAAMHQASQARAEAELAYAEWQLARTHVVAPTDGTITNLTVRVGDTGRAEQPLVGIVDAHAWRVMANYKQNFIRHFAIGHTAWVWLDSDPWRFRRARITGIARGISRDPEPEKLLPYVAPTTDWIRLQRRFPVTIVFDAPADQLHLYMGADARVVIFP
jgi:multidrug efflux system membrane fusion protein